MITVLIYEHHNPQKLNHRSHWLDKVFIRESRKSATRESFPESN